MRSIQTVRAKGIDNGDRPASRGSIDSTRSGPERTLSPRPAPPVDLVYLKNVLLQFMQLKDRNQKQQLIPALRMLLNLDQQEEKKWTEVLKSS